VTHAAAARTPRRLLAALAVLGVTGQAVAGLGELALSMTPLLMVVVLLVSGRYPGEARIVRHWRSAAPPPPRRARPRWAPVPARPAISIFRRSALRHRGPPASALPAT
jgi:hypothetical protein